jgi:hypothetical protein
MMPRAPCVIAGAITRESQALPTRRSGRENSPQTYATTLMKDEFQIDLERVTLRALACDNHWLSETLEVSTEILDFTLDCVGSGKRKGSMAVDGQNREITHFAHMCRVAFLMKWFFPNDSFGRDLALVHDVKEEALPGKEERWRDAASVAGVDGLSEAILLLTETEPTPEDVAKIGLQIPAEFDATYVAKYRNFISTLRAAWELVGNLELCDRFDASSDFVYLHAPRYESRLKYKALETFGRIWATIDLSEHPLKDTVKDRCRRSFRHFGISEPGVEDAARYFSS